MGFTGREHDESGLNYHRDRYLMPGVGRWTQADRLGMVDGPNLYQHARSRPTLGRDPHGLWTIVLIDLRQPWGSAAFGVHAALYLERGANYSVTSTGYVATPSNQPLIYDPSGGFGAGLTTDRMTAIGTPVTGTEGDELPLVRDYTLSVVTAGTSTSLLRDYMKVSGQMGLTLEAYYFNTTAAEEFLLAKTIMGQPNPGFTGCARSVSNVLQTSGVQMFSGIESTKSPANLAIQVNGILPGASWASRIRAKINAFMAF